MAIFDEFLPQNLFDSTTFQILGQKFIKFFCCFHGKFKKSESHSGINWPLGETGDGMCQFPFASHCLEWKKARLDNKTHYCCCSRPVFVSELSPWNSYITLAWLGLSRLLLLQSEGYCMPVVPTVAAAWCRRRPSYKRWFLGGAIHYTITYTLFPYFY